MVATSEDVARIAGVSRATVSLILNGRGDRFAADTKQRVRQAARDLQYQPSAAGRALAMGASDFVVALVPNTTFGGNLQELFEQATDLLAERGLTLVLRLSTSSPASLDRIVASMQPRAVLSLQPFTDQERTVLTDRGIPSFDTGARGDLNAQIGRLQAQHLIDRGYRHLVFAHLRDRRQDPFGAGREDGVRAACHEAGLPEPAIVGLGIDREDADRVLDDLPRGSGLACYNDDLAITLLSAAQLRGWVVPGDLGIVGMDNTPLSKVTDPRLTTVGYDMAAVAQNTVRAALLAMGDSPTSPYVDLNLRLIPGETS